MSYSYKLVIRCLENLFVQAQLTFFQALASDIEPFLKAYQSDNPLVPFLYFDLSNVLRIIISKFIKEDVLNNHNNISKIDVKNNVNIVKVKKTNLGYLTQTALYITEEATD